MPAYAISRSGRLGRERIHIKCFTDFQALHACQNRRYDNDWSCLDCDIHPHNAPPADTLPRKAGTYAYAGGRWHNVKSLDSMMLAHI